MLRLQQFCFLKTGISASVRFLFRFYTKTLLKYTNSFTSNTPRHIYCLLSRSPVFGRRKWRGGRKGACAVRDYLNDPRFSGLVPLVERALLSSPTMHGEELDYMRRAYESGWMTTVGENIDAIEGQVCRLVGSGHAVALSSGTAALHLAVKLAAGRLYGSSTGISTPDGMGAGGSLLGRRVFCSDLTFAATVNPVVYEGGEPVFIDSEYETWNMDPEALEEAFRIYPDVRLVVLAHLYGTPAKTAEILAVCRTHGALLVEDAAESLGAAAGGRQTGSFGDYSIISFNGNKIITGSSGGMLLTDDGEGAERARKWSTQSREAAPWYQHEELGYNYRISNVVAGVVRGQVPHLREHIDAKRRIYEGYRRGLAGLPAGMSPADAGSEPNRWLSCMLIDREHMCETQRSDRAAAYVQASGRSCPTEVLEALACFNAEGRPIWKPMHLQGMYRNNGFVTRNGNGRARTNAYAGGARVPTVSEDIFERGLCLPSDIKMTEGQQETVAEVVRRCFR